MMDAKAYTITGPEALSYSRAAEILSNVTGKEISYVNVSEEDTRVGLKAMGWDDWLINTTLQLFDLYRKGYVSRVSSEVQEILGRSPTPFTQFVNDYPLRFSDRFYRRLYFASSTFLQYYTLLLNVCSSLKP